MSTTVGNAPLAEVNLTIRQGSDVSFALAFSEKDGAGAVIVQSFAGWDVRAQIRARVGQAVWHELTVGDGLTLTDDAAGRLTVTGHIGHAVTEAAAWNDYGRGVWDVELVKADGWVIPLAAGTVNVTHDVTRVVA